MCIYIHTPMPSPLPLPSTPTQLFPSALCAHLDLRQLLKLFVKLAAAFHDPAPPPHGQRKFYQRIFCPLVTLWGMVLQRLLADPTLDNLVTNFFHGKADALRPGQNSPSQKIKSRQTASFSNARERLPLEKEAVWRDLIFWEGLFWPGRKASAFPWKKFVTRLSKVGSAKRRCRTMPQRVT